MSRTRVAIVALCCSFGFCASPMHAADVKPVASVTLPCDSTNQVISQNGKFVAATCPDKSLHVLEISTGREVFAQPADVRITARDFSRDGKWFALGFWDGTAKIVPLAGGAPVAWKAGEHRIHSIHFLAGGETIYTDGLGEPGQIWNFNGTPKLVATPPSTMLWMPRRRSCSSRSVP